MADNNTRIVLTAEDRASATLSKVGGSLDRLSGSAAGLSTLKSALGGLGAAFSAGALISFAKSTIDAADNINDLSQKVGISIRDLATWQLAAEQSGTSLESVARGVKALAVNMTENGAALKAAGISATDANGAMVQLADLFKSMPDGVEKTALAVKLFGKAGMDMIPMLNQGSRGLAEAQAKAAAYAEKLAELAPKADEFNDRLRELSLVGQEVTVKALLPMVEGLTGMVQWFKDATSGAKGLGNALEFVAEKADSDLLRGAAWVSRQAAGHPGAGDGVNVKTGQQILDAQKAAKATPMLPGENTAAEKADRARASKLLKDLGGGGKGAGKAAKYSPGEDFIAAQQAGLSGQSGLSASEVMRGLHAEDEALARTVTKQTEAADQALRKYRDMIDPLQKYRVQLEEVATLSGLSDDERLEATWKINEAMDAEIDKLKGVGDAAKETNEFARSMGLTFASAFEDAIVDGKEFSEVLQGLAKDVQRIVVRKTITEPLGNSISKMVDGFSFDKVFDSLIPKYAQGTNYVPNDGLAYLHAGEAVIPAGLNTGGGAGGGVAITQNITIDSRSDAATIRMAMIQAKNETLAAISSAQRRGG